MTTVIWLISTVLILLTMLSVAYARRNPNPEEAYLTVYEDGPLEMLIGAMLIVLPYGLMHYPSLSGVTFVLLYVFYLSLKRFVSKYQTGHEELSLKDFKLRRYCVSLALSIALLLSLFVFAFFVWGTGVQWEGWFVSYFEPLSVFVLVTGLVLWSLQSRAWRLLIYATSILAVYVTGFWYVVTFDTYAYVVGITLLLSGLLVMTHYVDDHSVSSGNALSG